MPSAALIKNIQTGTTTAQQPGVATAKQPGTDQIAQAEAATVDPSKVTVGTNDTVAGQLKGLLTEGSPLLEASRTTALQNMNDRGLVNSSMAVGAVTDAATRSFLPIAQQDASTNYDANKFNATNQFEAGKFNATGKMSTNQFNADATNKATLMDKDTAARIQTANIGAASQQASASISAASQQRIASLNAETQMKLGQMDIESKRALTTSSLANTTFNNSIDLLAKVAADPNMDAASKQRTTDNIIGATRTSIGVIAAVNKVDVGGLLNF